jgi:REP element-mobilizing transposase RayT
MYHVYNRGNRKQPIFLFRADRVYFMKKFRKYLRMCKISYISHTLMDNHYHLILQQGVGETISKFMQRLLTSYVQHFNKKYKMVGHMFQGRFKSRIIRNKQDLLNLIEYLKQNAVKAGYTENPDYYAWFGVADNPGDGPPGGQTP